MGVGSKLIPRRHKLRDSVTDPASRKIGDKFKPTKVLADSPGAFDAVRTSRRRQDRNFGKDSLDRKKDLAWYRTVVLARVDFNTSDYGIRITFPASTEVAGEGLRDGDEIKILSKASTLSGKRFAVRTERANVTNVSAGFARNVSTTVVRLPDINPFITETSVRVRVVAGAGVRVKSNAAVVEGKSLPNNAVFLRDTVSGTIS
jgi:hypothetical protein